MLLVVDVGSTNTVLGLYDGKELVHDVRIESSKGRTVDEYYVLIISLIQLAGVERERITASIVASVVPALSDPVSCALKRAFGHKPLVMGPGIKTGMPSLYENPPLRRAGSRASSRTDVLCRAWALFRLSAHSPLPSPFFWLLALVMASCGSGSESDGSTLAPDAAVTGGRDAGDADAVTDAGQVSRIDRDSDGVPDAEDSCPNGERVAGQLPRGCSCIQGLEPDPSRTQCVDQNECADAARNDCAEFATCNNTSGSYWCVCQPGYVGDGKSCTRDPSCDQLACGDSSHCARPNGGEAVCLCNRGTAGASCAACSAGQYCAGDGAEAVPCSGDTWDHDQSAATACAQTSTCSPQQYENTSPTSTSDRLCGNLTVCTPEQYESAAPTSTSNRLCSAVTVCTAAEFQNTPPSPTSDRTCSPLSVCGADQYQKMGPTSTSDRVCAALSVCSDSQFQLSAPTPVSDRVCQAITVCNAEQYESKAPTTTSDRVCSPLTLCNANQYQTKAPTPTSDRLCAALTACNANQYQSVAPTPISDRVCSALTACTANQYQTKAPTPTSDRTCAALTVCTANQYQSVAPTTVSDRACSALTVCKAWQFQQKAPTATSDRTCKVTTVCTPGMRQQTPPTSTSDRVCIACATGSFCAGNANAPVQCTASAPDHDQDPGTPCMHTRAIKQVASGSGFTCTLHDDGRVRCWGQDSSGQASVPKDLPKIASITAGVEHVCAVSETGSLHCWGTHGGAYELVPPPADLGPVLQVASDWLRTCAIRADHHVRCWGTGEEAHFGPPADLGTVSQVSVGTYTGCALRTDGQVRCWGESSYGHTAVPDDLGAVKSISAGLSNCALTVGGEVRCWGVPSTASHLTDVPEGLANIVAIEAGNSHACAIDGSKAVHCWTTSTHPGHALWVDVPDDLGPVAQLSNRSGHTCALQENGVLRCWGDNFMLQSAPPMNVGRAEEIVASYNGTCVLDKHRKMQCLGPMTGHYSVPRPTALPPLQQLLASYAFCALDIDGKVTCWGLDQTGETLVPADLGKATQLSFAYTGDAGVICALEEAGDVRCWGGGAPTMTNFLAGLSHDISMLGGTSACVLLDDGSVRCQQQSDASWVPPSDLRDVIALDGGYAHVCALQADSQVRCWGFCENAPSCQPAGDLGHVTKVEATDRAACALRGDGTVRCWGFDSSSGQSIAEFMENPDDLGFVTDVAAVSSQWACVLEYGYVHCFGGNVHYRVGDFIF